MLPESIKALDVAEQYALGNATAEELSAAYSAADSAADSAARSAARSAAYSAAYSAADSAARSAALSAAYSAADSAADSAAYSAADSAADSAVQGIWLPFVDAVEAGLWIYWVTAKETVIVPRPAILTSDGQLHADDRPAVSWPNGSQFWFIRGVQVDEQIVMRPEMQNITAIRSESNTEIKRIRIERYRWEQYLDDVGAIVVDQRRNDIEATHEALMKTPDGETVLVAACPSTARVYNLEVPPQIKTCEEAQNWLSGGLASRIVNAA